MIGFFDRYPVNPGHLLLVPHRHIESWFDATKEEQTALMNAIYERKNPHKLYRDKKNRMLKL